MKLIGQGGKLKRVPSHPSRMRGLKQGVWLQHSGFPFVASFTDAWIETGGNRWRGQREGVASCTDAWIETMLTGSIYMSSVVASFTDAWIETE